MSLNLPLVSIGVPTYNRPQTLLRTLNCLVNQTYNNLEIIVSDNCSTDPEVRSVVDKFISDPRIKYFRHAVNQGAIFNFNFVLEKSSGEFFMRLADDDWLDTNYIESAILFLSENLDYSGAYGFAKLYGQNSELIMDDSKVDFSESLTSQRVVKYFQNIGHNGTFYGLIRNENIHHLIMKNHIAIDWVIVSRVIARGKYKMLDNTNSYISLGGASATTENLVQTFNFSNFTKSFPFFTVCLNVFRDIVWVSSAYRELNFSSRLKLGCKSFLTIYQRFNVRKELRYGWKKFLRNYLTGS